MERFEADEWHDWIMYRDDTLTEGGEESGKVHN